MCRKTKKASFTVEASYMVPFTLFLYGILILITAVLLARCLSSQNLFLKEHREQRYTQPFEEQSAEAYGEVIYMERM